MTGCGAAAPWLVLLAGALLLAVPVALLAGWRLGRRTAMAEVEESAAVGLQRLRLTLGADAAAERTDQPAPDTLSEHDAHRDDVAGRG